MAFLHDLIKVPGVVNKVPNPLLVTVSYDMVFCLKIHHIKFLLFVTVITTPGQRCIEILGRGLNTTKPSKFFFYININTLNEKINNHQVYTWKQRDIHMKYKNITLK